MIETIPLIVAGCAVLWVMYRTSKTQEWLYAVERAGKRKKRRRKKR